MENLSVVTWFWLEKVRSWHARFFYPEWQLAPFDPASISTADFVPVDFHTMAPMPNFRPMKMGMHGGRTEFAD